MTTLDHVLSLIRSRRDELKDLGVSSVGVFGSVARGDDRPDSDVDVLIEFGRPADLFDLVRVKMLLESILNRRVDVVTPGAIRPQHRDAIYRDLKRAA
jgi:uncharacterized protein